ncbi:hypothetical protein GpartN1_g2005.t1 [Galdieria partita]|uniref:Nucleoporin protein Ndc1-Nup n=1 Tax=Galdieria partita TaxID=83374 RepID=A0A9C7PTM1_9RHOD|nr:hypothetical protein GpartN1_g2005.t1 [Galdieria partita]
MSIAETSQVEATLAAHISPITEQLVYGRALVRAVSLELLSFGLCCFLTQWWLPLVLGLPLSTLQDGEPFATSTVYTTQGLGCLVCLAGFLAFSYSDCLILSPIVARGSIRSRVLRGIKCSTCWIHAFTCCCAGFLLIPAFSTVVFSKNGQIILGDNLLRLGFLGMLFGMIYSLQVQYERFLVEFPHCLLPWMRRCRTRFRPAVSTSIKSVGYFVIVLLVYCAYRQLIWKNLVFISSGRSLMAIIVLVSVLYFHCYIGLEMFKVFASQRIDFEPPQHLRHIVGTNEWLIQGLISKRQPIVNWLAYLDMYQVALRFSRRCHALFSDVTGETWKIVCMSCIECMDSLTKELNDVLQANVPNSGKQIHEATSDRQKLEELRSSGMGSVIRKRVNETKKVLISTHETNQPNKVVKRDIVGASLELPIFGAQRKIRWAIQAIAFITAESRDHDKYGQAQVSLPVIISSMLQCHMALSSYLRVSLVRRWPSEEYRNASAIKDTLELSLCKLIATFPEYFQQLLRNPVAGWSQECITSLETFVKDNIHLK